MRKLPDGERARRDAEAKRRWRANNPEYSKEWYRKNKESVLARVKDWGATNKEKVLEANQRYREANPEKMRQFSKSWRTANRPHANALAAKYRSSKLRATPKWSDLGAIAVIYKEAALLGLHVDHIIPLRGKMVCGLHVPANLQLLTKSENSRKSNNFTHKEA